MALCRSVRRYWATEAEVCAVAEVVSLANIPVNQLAVKCVACKSAVVVQERKLRCKCGGIRVEADGEHGLKPFEVVKA